MSRAYPVAPLEGPRPALRVSFDIDDTITCGDPVPTEQFVPRWLRRLYPEAVRRGSRDLMRALARRGCGLWVYTSSRRPARYLHAWFRASMGVQLEGVVNQCRHEQVVGNRGPSKFPPAFGIGLHVDDALGVRLEGEAHGFGVVLVSPHDACWDVRVLEAVDALLGCAVERHPHRGIAVHSNARLCADFPIAPFSSGP